MNRTYTLLASLVFVAIALVLIVYSWVPNRRGLKKEQAKITAVIRQPGTLYKVEMVTKSGALISCLGRRQWPPALINRCPIEKFKRLVGQNVTVLHNGKHPYEVKENGKFILTLGVFRWFQFFMVLVALMMLCIAAFVLRREFSVL